MVFYMDSVVIRNPIQLGQQRGQPEVAASQSDSADSRTHRDDRVQYVFPQWVQFINLKSQIFQLMPTSLY